MLVLTRALGETVVVRDPDGNEVGTVMLLELRQGQAKLGFSFRKDYRLLRSELETQTPRGTPKAD